MLLISWNVAGLSTTLQRIDKDYSAQSLQSSQTTSPSSVSSNAKANPDANKKLNSKHPKKKTNHAFSYFLKKHGSPDILCIQEHKIPHTQLSSRSEPYNCTDIEGYESFWSCCTDRTVKKGFNGVVTYAKIGTVQNATCAPFNDPTLDNQGRCVMTDHGSFVVFNVYVPCGGAMPLSYKMKFLNVLQRCMDVQRREKHKKVILVGDLNISHTGLDKHWRFRSVYVNSIIDEVEKYNLNKNQATNDNNKPSLPTSSLSPISKWKIDVTKHWKNIEKALSTIEAIPVTTKNITTGSTFEKFRARVTIRKGGETQESLRKVFIGKSESSPEECLYYFTYPKVVYFDVDLQKELIAREENVIPLDILYEVMSKIASVDWGTSTLEQIANSEDVLSHPSSSPTIGWLTDVIENNNMVDAFRFVHPNAKGRFTCWNQRTNARFENMGTRIDYTLVDKSIAKYINKDEDCNKLRCCNYPINKDKDTNNKSHNTDEAAFHAATASGQFQGAAYHGGGIADASTAALETQFLGDPHTGIIYTPPSYSDHIAVSLFLNHDDWHKQHFSTSLALDVKCPYTKKTQPHKSQTSISSFFGKSSSSSSPSSSTPSTSQEMKRKPSVKQGKAFSNKKTKNKNRVSSKNSILSHFTVGNTK